MSEADNVAPEASENVAPVQEETTVQETTEQAKFEKFGELLSYASDDVKEAKTWEKFKDVDIPTALKAIVDMDKWTGKRGDIPQDGATDEEWKAFYEKKHYGLSEAEMDQVEASPLFNKLLGRIAKDLDEKGQVGNVFSQTQIGVKDELSDVEGQIREVLSTNGRNVNDPKLNTLLERRDRLQGKLA